MGYSPLYIRGMETGLVQSRQDFLLPDDAYPVLENAFVWRERIKRKQGFELLGRLQRNFTNILIGISPGGSATGNILSISGYISNITQANPGVVTTTYPHGLSTGNQIIISQVVGMTNVNNRSFVITVLSTTTFSLNGENTSGYPAYVSGGFFFSNKSKIETNAEVVPGTLVITLQAGPDIIFTDNGKGLLVSITPGNFGTVNYATGVITATTTAAPGSLSISSFSYYPGLPVMGLRMREQTSINNEQLVAFDQKYAYIFSGTTWREFIPGTAWSGNNSDFFWSTNYWVGDANAKIFWVTNDDGTSGEPIRYTNGTNWVNFTPQIDAAGTLLTQSLAILPFRGRLMVFNTLEGATLGTSTSFSQRIRWAAIGTPFTVSSSVVTTGLNVNAWRDDIRGQGGFLDIPTTESIVSVGFVRDNLVIYCERSTWQLRYTGRSISPFQIEKVNSELGADSTFSAIQFDTSLVGIGDKGVVECDSFKSNRIDIKIPDLIIQFNNDNNGPKRVHGIRDFPNRLAYWTFPFRPNNGTFPDRRLVYNYENDSWAIFTDSLTCLGNYQPQVSRTWAASKFQWQEANFPWIDRPDIYPVIVGGNQEGFVEILDQQTTNDVSLSITGITGNTTTPTVLTCVNHNLQTGAVVQIVNIPLTTPFATSLNGKIFGIVVVNANSFQLWIYDPVTEQFSDPQLDSPATYIGGGQIRVRDNFNIVSKAFNALEEGQAIQFGYLDVNFNATDMGGVTLNIYRDYNMNTPVNTLPQNVDPDTLVPDSFFNSTVPTTLNNPLSQVGSTYWQRVYCAVRSSFLTLEWTLSNAQMVGDEQESEVQINTQILWMRKAGKNLPIGV